MQNLFFNVGPAFTPRHYVALQHVFLAHLRSLNRGNLSRPANRRVRLMFLEITDRFAGEPIIGYSRERSPS